MSLNHTFYATYLLMYIYILIDYKLECKGLIDIQNKKKSQAKKVTGIQVCLFFYFVF